MTKKRFIFDLDNTLLTFDSDYQKEFFKSEFGEENPFLDGLGEYLATYWTSYPRFVDDRFVSLLSLLSGCKVKEDFVERWIDALAGMPVVLEEGVEDTLEYLCMKGKSLVVLTNWYGNCQIERLKKAGILSYFDRIYSGEYVLKPNQNAYEQAIASYRPEEAVFIGDNVETDYIGPRTFGYDAVLYDKYEKYPKNLVKIKKIDEIRERY